MNGMDQNAAMQEKMRQLRAHEAQLQYLVTEAQGAKARLDMLTSVWQTVNATYRALRLEIFGEEEPQMPAGGDTQRVAGSGDRTVPQC